MTTNKICNHDVHLKLYWIFDHVNIKGIEMTDKMTEKAHNFVLSSFKRLHHEMTAQMNLIRVSSQKNWDKKWKEETKEV